jgi:hypothetical protein
MSKENNAVTSKEGSIIERKEDKKVRKLLKE